MWRPKGNIRSPGVGDTGGSEPPNVGDENSSWSSVEVARALNYRAISPVPYLSNLKQKCVLFNNEDLIAYLWAICQFSGAKHLFCHSNATL